jgi:hypothetical protein
MLLQLDRVLPAGLIPERVVGKCGWRYSQLVSHKDDHRLLAGCLLRQDNYSALKELLARHEDGSAFWLYTRALVAFRESSDEQAAALVKDAWSANEHVPAILAGTKPVVSSNDGYITMGGPDEATYYVTECGATWHRTPGAVAWLTKLATTQAPKRRTRATIH